MSDSLYNLLYIAMKTVSNDNGATATALINGGSSYEDATVGGYTVAGYLTVQDLSKLPNALEQSESGNVKGYEVLVWGGDIEATGWAGDVDMSELKHFAGEYDAVMWLTLKYVEQLIYEAIDLDSGNYQKGGEQ